MELNMIRLLLLFGLLLFPALASAAGGNITNESFEVAKRQLLGDVYRDAPRTLYCRFPFTPDKKVKTPPGWRVKYYKNRENRLEFEHVVPAENFGRAFSSWRIGDPQCLGQSGAYTGRKCAEKVDRDYRLMQADLHNLFPAVGAVNALRSNYRFMKIEKNIAPAFPFCAMKVRRGERQAEPPDAAKGVVARATLYMGDVYAPKFRLSAGQKRLMEAWDRMYPVTREECVRSARREQIQGNANLRVKKPCEKEGWYDAGATLE